MTTPDASLLALVRRCWSEALDMPVATDDRWADAGGNSLASLNMLHALEIALGRKLSFDLIDPEMTPANLSRALAREIGDEETEAPVVCLVTGMYGDTPMLADFRRACGDRIRFEVINLPDVDAPAAMLADIPNTGKSIAQEIEQRIPAGDIMLGGFSFGGLVAFEAERQLTNAGRHVTLLVILDSYWPSNLHALDDTRPSSDLRRFVTWRYWRSLQPARDVVSGLAPFDSLRRGILAVTRRLRPQLYPTLRQHLQRHFRLPAMDQWQPVPTRTPTLLVVSDSYAKLTPPKWGALCVQLQMVQVAGQHLELFKPDRVAVFGPVFEAAARAAISPRGQRAAASAFSLERSTVSVESDI